MLQVTRKNDIMIRYFFTLLVVTTSFIVNAQTLPAPHGCAYDHAVHLLDQAYPGFKHNADQVFERNVSEISLRDPELYTIPVVVHVVWQEESQNIPDSQIEEVIASLNKDFRRLNADANTVRAQFIDVVGDPFIEFELVAIERQETEATFELDLLGGGLPDNVKINAEGGHDAWDTEKYLNIWLCNIEGGSILGYAYPPADLAHWPAGANAPSPELDGVVMHYEVFRTTGEYTATGLLGNDEITVPVRGRSITHEIGHYLGLRHIWGDGLLSIIGIPDCDADDGVADTPNQGLNSQFQCDPEQNSCEEGIDDLPDMFENFMDYAAEDCMNSFTTGQIAIMRSVLENERNGLLGDVTNVDNQLQADAFHVYPNPVKEQLFIQSDFMLDHQFQYQLVDQQGRLVQASKMDSYSSQQTLNIAHLPAGLYGLLLMGEAGQYFQKIVIQ